jgi:hypothetical protein
MAMVADSVPSIKRFLSGLGLHRALLMLVIRVMAGFLLRSGRMTCSAAAGAISGEPVHRAQISRFLARPSWRKRNISGTLRQQLTEESAVNGDYVLIIDATLFSHAGECEENTYSTGNRTRRPRRGRRYGTNKHARKRVHSFTGGMLITPEGVRIPQLVPFYTKPYAEQTGRIHHTSAETAAIMIRELRVPAGAKVFVLGDTAYDAKVVRVACAERGFSWIFPCNPERVLEGPRGRRPQLRSLLKDWAKWSRRTIRLLPGAGKFAAQRRLSAHRVGPKVKKQTFDVHEERRTVRSVGDVRLVFSTKKENLRTATANDVKILMTNDLWLSLPDLIELYSLRWQIELFFKELKSTLGAHQYQFRRFEAVEGWMELAVTSFLYLEWYRHQQLRRRGLDEKARNWWHRQRAFGIIQAIRLAASQKELHYLEDRLKSPGGITKLKRLLRRCIAGEYRTPA